MLLTLVEILVIVFTVLNQLVLKMGKSCYRKVAFKTRLKMLWRIIRDKQVVVITESNGELRYSWDTRSLEDVCQMCCETFDKAKEILDKK